MGRKFIPDVGRYQLTLRGPKDDICTWGNFVNNDVSLEQASVPEGGESIVKKIKKKRKNYSAHIKCVPTARPIQRGIARFYRVARKSRLSPTRNFGVTIVTLLSRRILTTGRTFVTFVSTLEVRCLAPPPPRGLARIRFPPARSRVVKIGLSLAPGDVRRRLTFLRFPAEVGKSEFLLT